MILVLPHAVFNPLQTSFFFFADLFLSSLYVVRVRKIGLFSGQGGGTCHSLLFGQFA